MGRPSDLRAPYGSRGRHGAMIVGPNYFHPKNLMQQKPVTGPLFLSNIRKRYHEGTNIQAKFFFQERSPLLVALETSPAQLKSLVHGSETRMRAEASLVVVVFSPS